jgi:hypothetical protein
MKNKKIKKGEYGYLAYQKKMEIIKTITLFVISLSIYIAGYLSSGKRDNLFTVIAILGMLPASKSFVSMVMFFRFKTGNKDVYDKVEEAVAPDMPVFYDAVITTVQKSYPVNVFCCCDGNLYGFTEDEKIDVKIIEKHFKEMLRNNGIKGVNVKLFTTLDVYIARIHDIREKKIEEPELDEEGFTKDQKVIALVSSLSL